MVKISRKLDKESHKVTKLEVFKIFKISNETWHALNSPFLTLTASRDILETTWKTDEESPVSPGQCSSAPAHKSVVAMAVVCDCGFELVDHPPHSPDLAPSIFSSPTWKKKIKLFVLVNQMQDFSTPFVTPLVFQAIHKMSLVLLFKVLNCLSSVGLSGRKQCSIRNGWI